MSHSVVSNVLVRAWFSVTAKREWELLVICYATGSHIHSLSIVWTSRISYIFLWICLFQLCDGWFYSSLSFVVRLPNHLLVQVKTKLLDIAKVHCTLRMICAYHAVFFRRHVLVIQTLGIMFLRKYISSSVIPFPRFIISFRHRWMFGSIGHLRFQRLLH